MTARARAPLAAAALAVATILFGTACTTSSQVCDLTSCKVNLTGEQRVKVRRILLHVGPIEPNTVTVASGGDAARLSAGQAAVLGGTRVKVVSVNAPHVSLVVE
ncbi:hypothetical protein [Pseudonocardia acaciae]|uniref:hypothetical protein n=1 Tax=Pseudonocardia acaciae TaxID=551276 RepID=UPI00048C7191|nr:hypothetical protein [Pseudonocardia acaciae]